MTDLVKQARELGGFSTEAELCSLMADEIERLRAALREAENALSDYVPTLEAKGHMMGYGKYVLAKVRTALGEKE